ncbi:hypothetical protein pb186bvf_009732 [Paramecium bursaria]
MFSLFERGLHINNNLLILILTGTIIIKGIQSLYCGILNMIKKMEQKTLSRESLQYENKLLIQLPKSSQFVFSIKLKSLIKNCTTLKSQLKL